MTSLCTREQMSATRQRRGDIERRVASAREKVAVARDAFHAACHAVTEAEQMLAQRRIEREHAAIRLARLADALESLERALDERAR